MNALIFSWKSLSLSVRWLNRGLSVGVRAQHQPIRTNLGGRAEQCLMERETMMVARQVMRESLDRDLGILDMH